MKKRTIFTSLIYVAIAIFAILCLSSCSGEVMDEDFLGAVPEYESPSGGNDVNLEINGSKDDIEDGDYQRKIIKTVNVSAETKQFDESVKQLEELCSSVGGYVERSDLRGKSVYNGSATQRYASYTLRIPADRLDEFNAGISNMLNVTYSSSSVDEVTNQYYDIQSRIEVLELQKESLRAMYDNYTDYNDIDTLLYLQDKLYDVIEEIEAYKTQLRLYDSKVAYSTVNLDITEVIEYTVEEVEETPFIEELKEAFLGGCEVSLVILEVLALAIAATAPVLLPGTVVLLVIALTVFLIVRGVIKRKKRKNSLT